MPTDRPIVFLAFADARSDLSSLKVEGWSLKDQFDELKQRGVIADVVVEEKASLERDLLRFSEASRPHRALPFRGSRRRGPPALAVGLRATPGLCRRARHAPGATTRTEAGLPQRLFDAPAGEAIARRGGARRDRHGAADRRSRGHRVRGGLLPGPDHRLQRREPEDHRRLQSGHGLRPGRGVEQSGARGKAPRSRRRDAHPRGCHGR